MIARTSHCSFKNNLLMPLFAFFVGCSPQNDEHEKTPNEHSELANSPASRAAASPDNESPAWYRTNINLKLFLEENSDETETYDKGCDIYPVEIASAISLPNSFFGSGDRVKIQISSEDDDMTQSGSFRESFFQNSEGLRCEFDAQFLEKVLLSKNENTILMQFSGYSNGWVNAYDTRNCQQHKIDREAFDIVSHKNTFALESACESIDDETGECNPATVYKLLGSQCEPANQDQLSLKLTEALFGVAFDSTRTIHYPGTKNATIIVTPAKEMDDPEYPEMAESTHDHRPLETAIKHVVQNLDKAQFTTVRIGWDFDYGFEPGSGLLNTYEYLRSLMSFEALQETVQVNVFAKGPHSALSLDLTNKFEFGHYNPEFIQIFNSAARELLKDKQFVEITRESLYEHGLIEKLQRLREIYLYIDKNDGEFQTYKSQYERLLSKKEWPEDGYRKFMPTQLDTEQYWNWSETAYYFWIRREIDGTKSMWISVIRDILDAYEIRE